MLTFPLMLLCVILTCCVAGAQTLLLQSFEDEACLGSLQMHSVSVSLVPEHATDGTRAARISFGVTDWPNLFFAAPAGYAQTDWSAYGSFLFDIYNPEDKPLQINVRIDDSGKADGNLHCRQTGVTIPPGEQVTVQLAMQHTDLEMRGGPPGRDGDANGDLGTRPLDLKSIIAFQFFLARPTEPHVAYIDNVRLGPGVSVKGIVDRFGQYTGAEWPGKVHTEEDLISRREAEAELLRTAPTPPDRDEWGGWANGPKLEATGWFRTEKVDDKWWLVTPAGTLFWSVGLDCVRPDNWGPFKDRFDMFTWLPEEGDPLYEHGGRGKDGVNFYGINVQRKYGPEWLQPWLDVTRKRMVAWGFNTIGNWSDDRSCASLRLPFTVPIHYGAPKHFPGGWNDIPDFFSAEWEQSVTNAIKGATDKWRENPFCIGYFVDNELSWGGWGGGDSLKLPENALRLGGDMAVKQEFTRLLAGKYGGIAALNAAWGTDFPTWDSFRTDPVELPAARSDAVRADLSMLLTAFARRYFTVVAGLMKTHAPNQLYLGPRFAVAPDEVVKVSDEFCDVVTYNIYGQAESIVSRDKQISAILTKPVLIGEFHFGAVDRGMFHTGLGPVKSQEARGESYARYVRTALNQPWCVGAHWFIYVDQALTGRFDGENYNIGFVSGTDTPYPELIRHATEINFAAYTARSEAKAQ